MLETPLLYLSQIKIQIIEKMQKEEINQCWLHKPEILNFRIQGFIVGIKAEAGKAGGRGAARLLRYFLFVGCEWIFAMNIHWNE